MAVFIACVIGYGVILPRGISKNPESDCLASVRSEVNIAFSDTGIHDHYVSLWMQSFKWCAITCVVCSNVLL